MDADRPSESFSYHHLEGTESIRTQVNSYTFLSIRTQFSVNLYSFGKFVLISFKD